MKFRLTLEFLTETLLVDITRHAEHCFLIQVHQHFQLINIESISTLLKEVCFNLFVNTY